MRSQPDHQISGRRIEGGHVHFSCSCSWEPWPVRDEAWKAEELVRHWAANQLGAGGSLGVPPRFIGQELAPAKLAAALGAHVAQGRVHLYVAGDQVGVWGLAPFSARGAIGPDSAGVDGFRASLFVTEHEARAAESRDRREYGVPPTPQRAFRVSVPVEDLRIPEWLDGPWGQRRFHARTFDVAGELAPADPLAAALTRADPSRLPTFDLAPGAEMRMISHGQSHNPPRRSRLSLRGDPQPHGGSQPHAGPPPGRSRGRAEEQRQVNRRPGPVAASQPSMGVRR